MRLLKVIPNIMRTPKKKTPYIINLRLSKYFVTFETTIWRLWELGFSRDFPVREDTPSDVSGSLVDWQPR